MNVFNLPGFESLASCFQSLLIVSAIGSVVVLVAIAFHMATSKWISATWLYVFWFLVLFRFVLFAAPESPMSLLNLVAQPTAVSFVESDAPIDGTDEQFIFSSETIAPIPIDEGTGSNQWSFANLWTIAAIAWFAVLAGLMFRLGMGYLSVKRLVSETSQPSSELETRFENLKRRLGFSPRTRLRISDGIEVPAMAGLFNPVVILPGWCCHELDNEQLEMVFAHELIHIRRRDGLIQLLAHLIVVLHWFNPLAWIAASFIESTRELSCDKRVIEIWKKLKSGRTQSGSATGALLIERKYGRTILDIAGRASSANNANQFSAAFLGGFVGSNQNITKQRIAMLVNSGSKLWLRNIGAAGFITLLLAVGYTSAQTICPPCPPAAEQMLPAPVGPYLPGPGVVVPMTPVGEALPGTLLPLMPTPADSAALPGIPVLLPQHPVLLDTPTNPRVPQTPAVNGVVKGAKPLPHSEPIILNAGVTERLKFDFQIPEIMVDDPAVVTAMPVAPNEIIFTAVAAGVTEVHVSNPQKQVQILRFRVVPDVRELKSKIKEEFPGVDVNVRGSTDGFVNLYGQVTTEQIAKVNEFVVANCDLPVRNQLSDTAPIAIKIKVYEVSTTKLKQPGIDWSKAGTKMPKDIESLQSLLPGNPIAAGNTLGFAKLEESHFVDFLNSLEKQNVAKLLEQPVLVAHHGRVAEFLSGGEIPFAVINEKGQPTVEFRSYGTKIQTTPYIHSNDEMTLEISAEVSEIDKKLSSRTGVPGFRVRRINTGLRVKPGQTIALIGDYRNEKNGDEESTELVFLMTPRLIEKGPEFKLSKESAALKASKASSQINR